VCSIALVACVAVACRRQPEHAAPFDGTWVMKLDDRVFIVLALESKNGTVGGHFTNPKTFQFPQGKRLSFSHIEMPIKTRAIARTTVDGSRLHIVVDDPDHPTEPDEYDLTLTSENQALLQLAGVPVPPFPFRRAAAAEVPRVATDWDPQRTYPLQTEPVTSSAEMKQIYDDDQRARQDFLKMSKAEWEKVSKDDAARREKTHELLMAGKLHSADDYRQAAFVFQHGDTPDDYLLAHTLAMIAVAKGDSSALWIGTATLDRYLQSIKRPQIYGTQFNNGSGRKMTQEPYDRKLIPDLLRDELGVPDLAAQQEQLKAWEAEAQSKNQDRK
jgi:hypothetical protein